MAGDYELDYIYLVRTRESMRFGEDIYKIGKTKQAGMKRMRGYDKGTEVIIFIQVANCDLSERQLLEQFRREFSPRVDRGAEYFEGNPIGMINLIVQHFNKTSHMIRWDRHRETSPETTPRESKVAKVLAKQEVDRTKPNPPTPTTAKVSPPSPTTTAKVSPPSSPTTTKVSPLLSLKERKVTESPISVESLPEIVEVDLPVKEFPSNPFDKFRYRGRHSPRVQEDLTDLCDGLVVGACGDRSESHYNAINTLPITRKDFNLIDGKVRGLSRVKRISILYSKLASHYELQNGSKPKVGGFDNFGKRAGGRIQVELPNFPDLEARVLPLIGDCSAEAHELHSEIFGSTINRKNSLPHREFVSLFLAFMAQFGEKKFKNLCKKMSKPMHKPAANALEITAWLTPLFAEIGYKIAVQQHTVKVHKIL
jgi:hypothetical protein